MSARLRVSSHPAAAWAEVVAPWLRAHGANWREKRAILAPNATWIAALKGGVVAAGLPVFGVEWHTPGRWRSLALGAFVGQNHRIALREDLHLLLELAAASLPENPLARAYGADPAPFQELLDTLESAGWSPEVLSDPAARELAQAAEKLRAQANWLTAAATDRQLLEAVTMGAQPRLGQKLLLAGFGPGDWPLAALLQSAAAAYEDCDIVFDVAEDSLERGQSAAAWIGWWEEKLGAAAEYLEAPAETATPFAALAWEIGEPAPPPAAARKKSALAKNIPVFWLAENLQAEADLAAAQALAFLRESSDARVGVVVGSSASPLAREVAARFTALGCPHHDATGHLPGRENAQALFEAWLDWQEEGRLPGLVAWVRAAARGGLLAETSAGPIEQSLHQAAAALLTDDPGVLAAWLGSAPGEHLEARAFLAEWPRLPELEKWDDLIKTIILASEKLHWPAEPEALARRVEVWRGQLAAPVPRAAVVRWVRAVTRVPGRTRAALGREPWARLQIVDAAGAAAQSWTHLVLGGLQHGEWPEADRESPLLDDAAAQKLNRQAIRQGPQGEGHLTVAPRRGLLLSAADRRRFNRANFARLVALPTQGLALTARLADPVDGRAARLSEYYWSVARAALGRLPTDADWDSLVQSSSRQREKLRLVFDENPPELLVEEIRAAPGPAQTLRAHQARRDEAKPFDEFSFCLRAPPPEPLRLSCKAWEEALKQPGASWFKYLLKAEPRWKPAEDDATSMTRGIFAHAWVRPGPENAPESFALPTLETWRKFAAEKMREDRARAAAAFAAAGRALPESWLDVADAAERLVGHWITALAGIAGWPRAFAEIKLPPGLRCVLPGLGDVLALSGRMDLVLFTEGAIFASGKLAGKSAWLFDFKTSDTAKPLSISGLTKYDGLQLALYALALRALGASEVSLTLLNAEADAAPQLASAQLADPELAPLWKLLGDFAVRGRWGELGDLEDEHARAGDYPSATLPVPVEILRGKWQRSHGGAE